jgi:phenylacetyl-CoA:acceptor oxidoreductase subunit 1
MKEQTKSLSRRDFVKLAAQLGLSVAVVEGLLKLTNNVREAVASENAGAESKHQWGMVIDLGLCTGCNYCTYACKATNDTAEGITWNAVYPNETSFGEKVYIPRPCQHCEDAPCVDVCPVKATYHRPDGIVVMDYDKCIGCRYCQVACPYGARYFNWEANTGTNPMVPVWGEPEVERRPRGVAEKCTFCVQRIDYGLEHNLTVGEATAATPACVNICPVGARTFGDLNDRDSKISKLLASRESITLREEVGARPRVHYLMPQGGGEK